MTAPPIDALIIGCGYLGSRVAAAWRADGRTVAALTRRRTAELTAAGLLPILGDVTDPATLIDLPPARTVLYAVGMDRRSGKSMREVYVNGVANVLDRLRTDGPFVYVSSTGVYGQTAGEWVDETAPTEPTEDSGAIVLEAERLIRARRPGAIVLRFSGIYGPGRILRKPALLAGEVYSADPDKWLNVIHVDDGVRAVLAACTHGVAGETYIVTDDEPVTRRAFYTRSAELLGGPPAQFTTVPRAHEEPNRRARNTKAKRELGWQPMFPTFREGLADAIRDG